MEESKNKLINLTENVFLKLAELINEENEIAINKINDLEKMLLIKQNNQNEKIEENLYEKLLL